MDEISELKKKLAEAMARRKLEYAKLYKEKATEIQAIVNNAAALVRQATDMADKFGVPFYSQIEGQDSYCPRNIEAVTGLSAEDLAEITGFRRDELHYGGWYSSSDRC